MPKASAKARGRHNLTAEIPVADLMALRAIAAAEDRGISSLVRAGVRHILETRGVETSEAAPRQKGRPQKERTAGAVHDPE